MTAPTDTDRQRAAALILALRIGSGRVAAIATALAEERERARAPFLALADRYAEIARRLHARHEDVDIADLLNDNAADLYRAAEDSR